MTIKTNDPIPNANLAVYAKGETLKVQTSDYFSSGKSIIFGLPGAYTPTCSKAHLPGFVVKADEIRAKGVDKIVCLSVNDIFVMAAWSKANNAEAIEMLADGNAEFSKALGLDIDASASGMGIRCCRFAAIVENGIVTDLFIEKPGEFEVSSAEYLLSKL